MRFKSEDVGRFYRDFLKDDVRKELDLLIARRDAEADVRDAALKTETDPKKLKSLRDRDPRKWRWTNESHGMPSVVQLRSLLLNEPPEQLAQFSTPDKFSGPASGVIGSCLAVLRISHPTRFVRLIPPGEPTPFVAGLERELTHPSTYLVQAVQSSIQDKKTKTSQPIWPRITWWGWKTPTVQRWTFGQVIPAGQSTPPAPKQVNLNWNTQVTVYP